MRIRGRPSGPEGGSLVGARGLRDLHGMSESHPCLPARPLALHRERVIQALSRGFSEDALTIDEFEHRLDVAVRATSSAELDALLEDLPGPLADAGAELGARAPVTRTPSPSGEDAARQHVIAIMSGNTRAGAWQPRRKIFAYAFWGGAELDFREAALLPGVTEVVAIGIMGGVDIVVPPGVGVEVNGFAFMGGLDHVRQAPKPLPGLDLVVGTGGNERRPHREPPPDAPRIRVTGFAFMGGVSVDVRHPGESSADARRRRRSEEKSRRLERRRDG